MMSEMAKPELPKTPPGDPPPPPFASDPRLFGLLEGGSKMSREQILDIFKRYTSRAPQVEGER